MTFGGSSGDFLEAVATLYLRRLSHNSDKSVCWIPLQDN
jgi:hypothetical protein